MENKQNRIGILAISFTIVVASMLGSGFFNLLDTVVGISLLLLLKVVSYSDATKEENMAFAAVNGLAWVLILGVAVDSVLFYKFGAKPNTPLYLGSIILAAIWLAVSLCSYKPKNNNAKINE